MSDNAFPNSLFDDLESTVTCGGVEPALAQLVEHLRGEGRFHELFDARLMQIRHALALPIVLTVPLDDLPEPVRTQLENGYLDICKEIGWPLLEQGRLRDAWAYLRPLGDNAAVAAALQKITPNDDNLEELIGISLQEGVAPAYGFSLILSHYGTCNAITTFDAEVARFGRKEQAAAAALLVRQLHADLVENLRTDIAKHDQCEATQTMVPDLIGDRPWLFENANYHIDTTHLNAAMRIARVIDEPDVLRLAWELAQYGLQLDEQFQFAGDEPFVETYRSHALFYGASFGEAVDAAVEYFKVRAEAASSKDDNPYEAGTLPAEVYVVLLVRLQRYAEAVDAAARYIPPGTRTLGFAPSLMELSRMANDYGRLKAISRERGELLVFAAACIAEGRK